MIVYKIIFNKVLESLITSGEGGVTVKVVYSLSLSLS